MILKKRIVFSVALLAVLILLGILENKVNASEKDIVDTIASKENMVEENQRSTLRAFYTAPPVIPHEVAGGTATNCLECHATVTNLDDGRVAMATPHPQFTNCQQCHVVGNLDQTQTFKSDWHGLEEPEYGNRWSGVSPPTIPHRLFLRENCLSCHNAENPNMRMRTPHPQRTSCLQCHVPDYTKEF
jgi:nitrate reductase cytochrome c-type subunit